ncbi:putative Rpf-interacting protein [Gordonia araii NBRC 100433]|uniref:Putative Rpf-interacting protein n=1 Tax=Gordonia araii NBRC 100433 TaxID=1073574 RepID=G7H5L8_9ACTN|nr:putative Rpf-interacting protein [Gordonia araii NBRC 100433]
MLTAAVALTTLVAGVAGAAPTDQKAAKISSLVNQVATSDQNLTDLDNTLAVKREAVNRALVDFQNSIVAERLATVAALGARKSLKDADRRVATAQKRFDAYAERAYRRGPAGSMRDYVSSDNPQQVLDQVAVLDRVSAQQRRNIERLKIARNQKANRAAAAEASRRQAASAARSAASRRTDAITAVKTAQEAMRSEQQRRLALLTKRAEAQNKLNALRGINQRVAAPVLPGIGAIRTDAVDSKAAMEAAAAAAKLAADVAQKVLAGVIGSQQIPHSALFDELGLGGSDLTSMGGNGSLSRLSTGSLGALFGSTGSFGGGGGQVRPGLKGPQAVELVVNRAMSQLNQPYAWGGGDANGPTKGIRDGGVADAHGDYNKIGFDCSGLMIYAFAGIGIDLPHYTGYQYTSGPQVPISQMQRGDMIFWGANASQHVALYLGNNQMVEAPQSGDVVKVSPVRMSGTMPMVVRLW